MMETVPDDLLTYQHLSRLSLVDESIATLPEDMGALYKLKLLRLDSNLLTGLPASLARLSVLTALHVNHNRLSKIQECVWLLGALQVAFSPFIRAAPPSAAALEVVVRRFLRCPRMRSKTFRPSSSRCRAFEC